MSSSLPVCQGLFRCVKPHFSLSNIKVAGSDNATLNGTAVDFAASDYYTADFLKYPDGKLCGLEVRNTFSLLKKKKNS